jgi:TFIIF-interacting CTD phosphatase-like protein
MRGTKNKINICLDLDQTLIWAGTKKEYMPHKYPKLQQKATKFDHVEMDSYYTVFERPGLQDFLDFVFENFNVSIWTAASKDYALFIIKNIIYKKNRESRVLDWVFFSYHCDISNSTKKGTKDLSLLYDDYKLDGFVKDNTFIIDDYDEVYNTQPKNCIEVPPFVFTDDGNEEDSLLKKLRIQLDFMLFQNKKGISYTVTDINKALKGSNKNK